MDNLKSLNDALDLVIKERKKNQELTKSLGVVNDTLKPLLEKILANSKLSKEELISALSSIKVPEIKLPDFPKIEFPKFPEIPAPIVNYTPPIVKVPKPEVIVNVPDIKIPDLRWPKDKMPIIGDVNLLGIDLSHPLPVQLRDSKGNGIDFSKMGGSSVMVGGGSGKMDFFTIKDIQTSAGASIIDQEDGAMKVVGALSLSVDTNAGDSGVNTLRVITAKSVNASTIAVSVGADASTNIALTNLNRKSIAISHNAAFNLYVSTGVAASSSGFPIVANQVIIFDDYTGPVNAIADPQAGTISVRYIEID